MGNHDLFDRHVPQTRTSQVHHLLVIECLALDLRADVREASDAVDAGGALEEGNCFLVVAALGVEGARGEGFGGGDEVAGVDVVVGVVDVILCWVQSLSCQCKARMEVLPV